MENVCITKKKLRRNLGEWAVFEKKINYKTKLQNKTKLTKNVTNNIMPKTMVLK